MEGEFVKGDKVEVCSKLDGFFGSYFEAKVLSKLPHGSFYKVKYKNLVTEGEDPLPLIEIISADEIRPMPPKLSQPSTFRRHDRVDAFDLDAWWFGEIIGRRGDTFSVYFPTTNDVLAVVDAHMKQAGNRLYTLYKQKTIEMRVHMDCVGCESRVKSALQKMRGVDEVDIDMVQQKVTVTGYADQKKVLKKVRKTGRRAELWQLPFNPDHSSLLGGGSNSTNGGYFYNPHGCNGPINHHAPVPGSSYNYYKHGYDSNDYSSYQHHPVHASIFSHQAGSKFSDENPNAACSIM
ncbi:hypothetical protein Bca101_008506 [Brassica carinata]